MRLLGLISLMGFTFASAASVSAGTIQVNVTCGYLCDSLGVSAANRLPADTLFVLVADLAGDGFNPLNGDWVSGDDVLVKVSDFEFPGGTKGFDMASGTTDAGLFSRTLGIDLAQFVGRSTPVPVALRWFPGFSASGVNLAVSKPATGSAYGEFFRMTPLYPQHGGTKWQFEMSATGNVTLDPFATVDFDGVDPAANGMARWRVLQDGRVEELRLERTATGIATLYFRGSPGRRYEVQRSDNLILWEEVARPATDAFGACIWEDPASLPDRAFYRVRGPLLEP